MTRPRATCSLPSCRRPAAFATSRETVTVVLCRAHHERLVVELAQCGDATARQPAADPRQRAPGPRPGPVAHGRPASVPHGGLRALAAVPEPDRAEVALSMSAMPDADLAQSPIGDSEPPANERQARALAAVPEGAAA